jgi:hypothetical protein
LVIQSAVGELPLLPDGEVGEAEPWWRRAARSGHRSLVERTEFAAEDAHRPAVTCDVMGRQHEDVRSFCQTYEQCPPHRTALQVEAPGDLAVDHGAQRFLGRLTNRKFDVPWRFRDLPWIAAEGPVAGTEDLVPLFEPRQCGPERIELEPPGEAERQRDHILGAPWRQLIEEPEPALTGGQRDRAVLLTAGDRIDAGARDEPLAAQPTLQQLTPHISGRTGHLSLLKTHMSTSATS